MTRNDTKLAASKFYLTLIYKLQAFYSVAYPGFQLTVTLLHSPHSLFPPPFRYLPLLSSVLLPYFPPPYLSHFYPLYLYSRGVRKTGLDSVLKIQAVQKCDIC